MNERSPAIRVEHWRWAGSWSAASCWASWAWHAASDCRRAAPSPGIVICGVLWFGVYNVTFNAAELPLDAGIAALLVNVSLIFIAGSGRAGSQRGLPPRGGGGATAWMVYLGMAPTAIGFVTWAYALAHTSAGRWVDHLPGATGRAAARLGDAR